MNLGFLSLVVALVLFAISAFNVGARVNLQSAGLAFLTLALILDRGVIG